MPGDGLADGEGIADGEHDVAHLERVRVGEFERGKTLVLRLEAQHREVRARISQHHLGFEFALVRKRDLDLIGSLDDVIVGHHETRGVDEDARAQGALDLLARSARAVRDPEEAPEDRIVEQAIADGDGLGGIDIDHGRRGALHHRRVGQAKLVGRGGDAPLQGTFLPEGAERSRRQDDEDGGHEPLVAKRDAGLQRHGESDPGAVRYNPRVAAIEGRAHGRGCRRRPALKPKMPRPAMPRPLRLP